VGADGELASPESDPCPVAASALRTLTSAPKSGISAHIALPPLGRKPMVVALYLLF